eukprot:2454701-Rhodomonas_salina.2
MKAVRVAHSLRQCSIQEQHTVAAYSSSIPCDESSPPFRGARATAMPYPPGTTMPSGLELGFRV